MTVEAASRVYDTAPMYVTDQPPFLNAALRARTDLGPLPLLRRVKEIEAELGRQARTRFGPREIDIDLIAYGRLAYRFVDKGREVLRLPHPRVAERRFVLAPLADVAPKGVLPGFGPIETLLSETNDQSESVLVDEDAVLSL